MGSSGGPTALRVHGTGGELDPRSRVPASTIKHAAITSSSNLQLILAENVYNMDETGVMLCMLTWSSELRIQV
jgi:hypothetical protein